MTEEKRNSSYKGNMYMMLGRLQMDCQGAIDTGRCDYAVWCYGSAEADIREMAKIYNSLSQKPEWISMKDIENYSLKLTGKSIEELCNKQ